ncbi:MAG: hypothetical protein Kow001_10150 [Acidobacteriota bacterium]
MDPRGNVYYTDLEQVWKIAPDGSRSLAVPRVHTHELVLDRDGNLYGEHLWYEGEASDRWGHYVWRLGPDGSLKTILGPRPGFLTDYDYSFVRDETGTMYWVDRDRGEIRRRNPDGTVETHARGEFRQVGWMTASREGTLYLTHGGNLLKVARDGQISVVARDLHERSLTQPHVSERHNLMGLWLDPRGNVYVAVWGGRLVKRVTPDGGVSTVTRAGLGWGPTGGLVAPDGALWILETSVTNAVRVRRIGPDGSARTW